MHEIVKKAADKGDRERIKFTFVDALDADPTFEKYQEDFDYCKEKGLFDTHMELTRFRLENLDENYWFTLKKDFQKNASIDRLNHMRKVAKILYADKINRLIKEREEEIKGLSQQLQDNVVSSSDTAVSSDDNSNYSSRAVINQQEKNNQSIELNPLSKEKEISLSEQQINAIEEAKRKLKEEEERKERERNYRQNQKKYSEKNNFAGKNSLGMGLPLFAAIVMLIIIVLIVFR